MNYLVADIITRMKNAARARRREVSLPYSKLGKEILKVLSHEGFVELLKEEEIDGKKLLKINLAYEKRTPVLTDVLVLSKPSLRKYAKAGNRQILAGIGLETIIVSTSKGVMTGKEAFKKGIGGELLFKIW